MNLDNTLECSYPFKHCALSECLDNETLNEIKTKWFNSETIEFLTNECNCNFS